MTQQELQITGWDQWQGAKPMKNEMDQFLSGDEDLVHLMQNIDVLNTKIDALKAILKQLAERTWQLKSIVEWKRFLAGM